MTAGVGLTSLIQTKTFVDWFTSCLYDEVGKSNSKSSLKNHCELTELLEVYVEEEPLRSK